MFAGGWAGKARPERPQRLVLHPGRRRPPAADGGGREAVCEAQPEGGGQLLR